MMSKFWGYFGGGESPYLPTHWRNGGSSVGSEHTFKGGLTLNLVIPGIKQQITIYFEGFNRNRRNA